MAVAQIEHCRELIQPPNPPFVSEQTSIQDAVIRTVDVGHNGAIITRGEAVEAIFTEIDLLRHLSRGRGVDRPVSEACSSDLITVHSAEMAIHVLIKMAGFAIRHLPVMRDGVLEGLATDLALLRKLPAVISGMEKATLQTHFAYVPAYCFRTGHLLSPSLTVGDLALPVKVVADTLTLSHAAREMRGDITDCLIVEGDEPGILTTFDIMRAVSENAGPDDTIASWTSRPIKFGEIDARFLDLSAQLTTRHRHIVLEEDGEYRVISERWFVSRLPGLLRSLFRRG